MCPAVRGDKDGDKKHVKLGLDPTVVEPEPSASNDKNNDENGPGDKQEHVRLGVWVYGCMGVWVYGR